MTSLVIVGNAELKLDYSRLVDEADIVIRINDCKNYDGRSGSKTSVICANNLGVTARKACAQKWYLNNALCRQASEYWFLRSGLALRTFVQQNALRYPLTECVDVSRQIVADNELGDKSLVHGSTEFNLGVYKSLILEMRKRSKFVPFICPSTGFLAIEHALSVPAFAGFEKHLVGFSFEGWTGHPWELERRLVTLHARTSRLVVHPA